MRARFLSCVLLASCAEPATTTEAPSPSAAVPAADAARDSVGRGPAAPKPRCERDPADTSATLGPSAANCAAHPAFRIAELSVSRTVVAPGDGADVRWRVEGGERGCSLRSGEKIVELRPQRTTSAPGIVPVSTEFRGTLTPSASAI